MGGYGSGQRSDRPLVEQALKLDIDRMKRCGVIQVGSHVAGTMRLTLYDDDIDVRFEARAGDPWYNWLRLKYMIANYETGEPLEVDDQVRLVATIQPNFGGSRWWFVCPHTNRRVRQLLLPLGAHHFLSRQAYGLGYECQRERAYDRAVRRVRKLHRRLGGDPADGVDKPPRMRWATYARLVAELDAAERAADANQRPYRGLGRRPA
jgi:hypothetical protein